MSYLEGSNPYFAALTTETSVFYVLQEGLANHLLCRLVVKVGRAQRCFKLHTADFVAGIKEDTIVRIITHASQRLLPAPLQ